MLTPLTTTLCLSGRVRSTSPCLPLSLPATTITGSPGARSSQRRLGCSLFLSMCFLENLWCEGDDLHEVALAQLAGDRTEDTSPPRVVGLGQQDRGVLVEPDQRPVRPLVLLVHAHDDGLDDLALLHLAAGLRGLHGRRDDVAHVGVLAIVAAGHADDQELLRPRVVRDLEPCLLLNHFLASPSFPGPKSRRWGADFGPKCTWRQAGWVSRVPDRLRGPLGSGRATVVLESHEQDWRHLHYRAFSTISSSRHRFSLEMGRVSVMRTRSPTPHSFFSSCTLKRVRCWTVLRYRRCALDVAIWTMTVLSILSAMTVPRRTLRRPRWGVSATLVSARSALAVAFIPSPLSWTAGRASWAPRLQPAARRRRRRRPPAAARSGRSRSRARAARS